MPVGFGTQEAAEELGVSTARIRQLLQDGSLRGQKLSERVWVISRASVRGYKNRRALKIKILKRNKVAKERDRLQQERDRERRLSNGSR
jgi:excisionase family DNA binding protein